MWLPKLQRAYGLLRLAGVFALAGLTAACFQPMYAAPTVTGNSSLRTALAAVDVQQIEAPNGTALARIAVEVRNELMFGITGAAGSAAPTHRLRINLVPNVNSIIIDPTTLRPEFENFGLDVKYTLTELATNKPVVAAAAAARVTYDIPGQAQRFARARGLRDAETRAAKLIAEQIKSRLASYFIAGT